MDAAKREYDTHGHPVLKEFLEMAEPKVQKVGGILLNVAGRICLSSCQYSFELRLLRHKLAQGCSCGVGCRPPYFEIII